MESAEKANEALLKVPYPGAYLVDHLPILKHVPAWLPGAKFKRDANEWRKLTLDSINKPFDALKAEMVGWDAGKDCICLTSLFRLAELQRLHLPTTCFRKQSTTRPKISIQTPTYETSQHPYTKVSANVLRLPFDSSLLMRLKQKLELKLYVFCEHIHAKFPAQSDPLTTRPNCF
jgi:hypothetical protein